ncbi:hypothetical protein GYH30_022799 [Glycine max]|nr:hypothetical protein GYH30_022799 [Glycine max]
MSSKLRGYEISPRLVGISPEANTTSTATIGGGSAFSIKEHQVKPLIPRFQEQRRRRGFPPRTAGSCRVKKKVESTVLFFDEIEVLARAINLENSVPIEVVVGDWLLSSEEDVEDGQDLVGAFEEQFGFIAAAAWAEVLCGEGQGLQDPVVGCGEGEEEEAGGHDEGSEVTFSTKTTEGEGRYPKQISTV